MNLSQANINYEYIIKGIDIDENTKARLQVLGVLRGTKVKIMNKRNNGAIILKIRGTRLGVDKEIAKSIQICDEILYSINKKRIYNGKEIK